MILNREQIKAAGIVAPALPSSCRSTTYDATIGDIIDCGAVQEAPSFILQPRGVVWVVSNEDFTFGDTTTGLATLKTTWTHRGLLALNVGVIDPGWKGPLATALVNFSGKRIEIRKGEPFFRVMVFTHDATGVDPVAKSRSIYLSEIQDRSRMFAATFLDTDSLVDEVALAVFKFPKWAIWLGWAGFWIAVISIFAPMAASVFLDHRKEASEHAVLEQRIQQLEARPATMIATPPTSTVPKPSSVEAVSGASLHDPRVEKNDLLVQLEHTL